jgi:hypothetical protein
MKRVSNASRAANLFGAGKDGYTAGVPGMTQATRIEAAAENHVQEEIAGTVEACGETLDPADTYQLKYCMQAAREVDALLNYQVLTAGTSQWRACDTDGAGMIVLCGDGGGLAFSTDYLATSIPGTPGSGFSGNFAQCAVAANVFVAVGGSDIQSSIGPFWATFAQRVTGSYTFQGVAYGAGKFVAVALNGTQYDTWTSTNGVTWAQHASAMGTTGGSGGGRLTYGGGIWMSQGGWTSPDGINWTSSSIPLVVPTIVAYHPNQGWLAYVKSGGTRQLFRSATGLTGWHQLRFGGAQTANSLLAMPGTWSALAPGVFDAGGVVESSWNGRQDKVALARDFTCAHSYGPGARCLQPIQGTTNCTNIVIGPNGTSGGKVLVSARFASLI